ncbi:60S ribosomal protein L33-B [Aspergillus awamori]|uniref:60S ribosomal protein L33-B n=3 Tax=Aspergillus TaxID=5052 RepID=A0A401KFG1_ASPAW|nr:hypothetical protein M747DRAFT_338904 [Aspergillus niger ATCC 13496]TPR08628.1 hypothetical protein CAN33_005135 [Aspergillus niger]GCB18080.1 60S ribosomal protein L33-B [Aspergillus awamori]
MGGKKSASCFVSLGRSSQKLSPPLQRGPAGSQESSDYSSPDGKIGQVGGRHVSYQRSKRTVNPNTSLIKIDGVESTEAANFYLGKKVAFVYRAKREVRGSNIRVIWGKVTRPHGNSGVVRAQFRHNLPPKTFGATVRVMLYPSNI